ncbi:hypothetical protein [Thioclava sp.]|uniref:hypothetical protein n=1 Tax=Thioclava sp. TaxID=1933450 RepID=UPI003AA97599
MQKTFKTTPVLALLAVMTLGALAGCTETQGAKDCKQTQGTTGDEFSCDVPNMRATIENPM